MKETITSPTITSPTVPDQIPLSLNPDLLASGEDGALASGEDGAAVVAENPSSTGSAGKLTHADSMGSINAGTPLMEEERYAVELAAQFLATAAAARLTAHDAATDAASPTFPKTPLASDSFRMCGARSSWADLHKTPKVSMPDSKAKDGVINR